MVELDTGEHWLDAYIQRMQRNGAVVTNVSHFREWDSYAINFRLDFVDDGEVVGSSMEIHDNRDVEVVVIRLPTVVVGEGDDYDNLVEKVEDAVAGAISDEFDLEYKYGVVQNDNVSVKSATVWKDNDFTTHVVFSRDTEDGMCILDSNDVIRLLSVLNDVWESELFMLDVARRGRR